jgi:antitoxin component YwqK of YwqJK toxin-antitoxin module
VSYDEKGNMANLICADKDLKGLDSEICGWKGHKEITLHKAGGLVNKYTMQRGKVRDVIAHLDKDTVVTSVKTGAKEETLTIKRKDQGTIKVSVKDSRPHGTSYEYDKAGNLLNMSRWESGKLIEETLYWINKNIKSLMILDKDKISYKRYSSENKLIEEGGYALNYDEYRWEGMIVERWSDYGDNLGSKKVYYESGEIRTECFYNKESNLEGDFIAYFPGKKISWIRSFKNGDVYHIKELDINGKVITDDEVFNDGSIKKK